MASSARVKELKQRDLLDQLASLRQTIETLNKTIENLTSLLAASQEHERVLQEEIDVRKKRFFGRSSEKHMAQSEGQLDFFNEIEVEADKTPEEELVPDGIESEQEEQKKTERKRKTTRREQFRNVTVVEEPAIDTRFTNW